MKTGVESRLRKVALALSAVLLLQLLWSGARLLLFADPEPIAPADSALRVDPLGYPPVDEEGAAPDFVTRPLFWSGREAYRPPVAEAAPEPVQAAAPRGPIKGLRLLGVYAAGANSGIIVAHAGERKRLRIDDEVAGWTFSMMSADGAIFESGEETRVLQLEHAVPPAGKAARRNARRPAGQALGRNLRGAAADKDSGDKKSGQGKKSPQDNNGEKGEKP
ncbi:MAG: hypothetical protein CME59_03930 [Halioglobus sp.]|nr:hypothetical protein [Halioglobus sp.]